MDFTFSDDQEQLRRAVRQLGVTAAEQGRGGKDLWGSVAQELGLLGIGIPEARGGAGGDFVDAAVVIEESGRTLLPAPLTTGLVAAAVIGSSDAAPDDVVADVAAGERVAVVAVGTGVDVAGGRLQGSLGHVLDGDVAELVVVAGADALWLVDLAGSGVTVRPLTAMDPTRGQAQILLDGVAAVQIGGAREAGTAVDLLRVALSVEAVGAARHCLQMTVTHLLTREQFGRPIGSFQALQHRAADLVVCLEAAASTAYYAAWAASHATDELAVVAPMAKALCGEAAWNAAAETIQMHGGIGFTWEHAAHRYFKRLTTTRLLLGDAHAQRRLVAQRAGLAASGTAPSGR